MADVAYASALDAGLRAEGYSTFYHPRDIGPGGNIAIWMDEALLNSAQTLALYSPDYTKEAAVYSKAERYAAWWQDPSGDKRKLIPIMLRQTSFTPLLAMVSRIDVSGLSPNDAATYVINQLKKASESEQRNVWRSGLPLPSIFKAIYRPNPNFVGRFEALEAIHQRLEGSSPVRAIAVIGTGGIGKTTIASEYAHRFGGRYGGVWWVRADQALKLLGDLRALGRRIGLSADEDSESEARAALDFLAAHTEPWLLIYDNATSSDAIREWLPLGAVRCIITSRVVEFEDCAPTVRLDNWPIDVTTKYLLTRTERDDVPGATRLAGRLDGLPLAAEQASVFLRPRRGVSFHAYEEDIVELIKRPRPLGQTGEYPETVYAVFVKSFSALEKLEFGLEALSFMGICAFLSPSEVDEFLFTSEHGVELLKIGCPEIAKDGVLEDVLAVIGSMSLLRRADGPLGPVLIFHRLMMEVMRDWMGFPATQGASSIAAHLVNRVFPDDPHITPAVWQFCGMLMPHVESLLAHAHRKGGAVPPLVALFHKAAFYCRSRGLLELALELCKSLVDLVRTNAEQSSKLANALSHLAGVYEVSGRLNEARATLTEVVEILGEHGPERDHELTDAMARLFQVCLLQKDYVAAETLGPRQSKCSQAWHKQRRKMTGNFMRLSERF
jgi:hypothetical protein